MAHRLLATLTITHHGVPIGRTSLLEVETPHCAPAFAVDGFEPLAGYDSVRTVVQRATLADQKFGYLGPVADPDSDRLGREARQAREALVAELEFHDQEDQLVPVEHIIFEDGQIWGEPYLGLGGTIEQAWAGVIAYLRTQPTGDTSHEQPPA